MPTRQQRGAAVAGFAAVALIGLSFLDWFRLRPAGSGPPPADGPDAQGLDLWQAFGVADLVAAAAIVTALILVYAALVRGAMATTMALSSLAVLIGLITVLVVGCGLVDPGARMTREPAAYAGLLASAGIVAGGYLGLRDDRPGRPGTLRSPRRGGREPRAESAPRMLR